MASLLGKLLAAWRTTHDPELEPLIGKLGIEVARQRGALKATSKAALETMWRELANACDPDDLDRLLDTPWPGAWKAAKVRVAKLADFGPDPRMHKLAIVAADYASYGAAPLHAAIARVLAKSPTKLLDAPLAIIRATTHVEQKSYEAVEAAVAKLRTKAASPALLAEARSTGGADVAALFSEHAQRPGDLALRAVLGDALQASGDPRGELIALQLRGDPKTKKRIAELLAMHRDTLLGPLPGVVAKSLRFERGFVTSARLTSTNEAKPGRDAQPVRVHVQWPDARAQLSDRWLDTVEALPSHTLRYCARRVRQRPAEVRASSPGVCAQAREEAPRVGDHRGRWSRCVVVDAVTRSRNRRVEVWVR